MSARDLQEQLRRRAGEAMARSVRREAELRQRQGDFPKPGDIYLFAGNVGSPVEWVVLDQDPADAGRWIAAPADTNPMAGSSDLALTADASAGSLTLRLHLAASLTAEIFGAATRRGVLEAENLELARRKREQVAGGRASGTLRQRDTDEDPAYEDWIREVVEPARRTVLARNEERREHDLKELVSRPERRENPLRVPANHSIPARQLYALAAVFALVVVGLSVWIGLQRSQIRQLTEEFSQELTARREELARLSRPSLDVLNEEIVLNDRQRIMQPIHLPPDSRHLLLVLVVHEREPCESYRLELWKAKTRVLESEAVERGEEFRLILPRAFLSADPLQLRLHGLCGGDDKLLEERELLIEYR